MIGQNLTEDVSPSSSIRREAAIPVELKRAQSEIGIQMEMITSLEQRLEPVLRPEPPNAREEKDPPPPPGLAGAVSLLSRAVNANTRRLKRILSRLEV